MLYCALSIWHESSTSTHWHPSSDQNRERQKREACWKILSFPRGKENPSPSTSSNIKCLKPAISTRDEIITPQQGCYNLWQSSYIVRPELFLHFTVKTTSLFPLKMHLMVLVSNQLIRRLELSPSWYQLILSFWEERTAARGGVDKLSLHIDRHSSLVKCQPLPQY